MVNVATELKPYISPFSLRHDNTLKWTNMTSKEIPMQNGMLNVPHTIADLIKDLAVVGVIGSAQCKRLYVRSDTSKKISKAIDLGILKRHELIRNNQIIPLYTLGATGMYLAGLDYEDEFNYWRKYSEEDVLQRLVFFQLYGQMKDLEKMQVLNTEDPFVASIKIHEIEFKVLVLRGNETVVQNYFRYEKDIPSHIVIVAEGLNHILPIQDAIKPYADRIRLTTDERLKLPFGEMFYYFDQNKWVLENTTNKV